MYVNKSDQQCQKLVKISDLVAYLHECNNDAQKKALWGEPQIWHILCLTEYKMSILEHFCKGTWEPSFKGQEGPQKCQSLVNNIKRLCELYECITDVQIHARF